MADVPREIFFTKGVGRHRHQLASFEEALRDARIARFNLVHVSSIFPPHCKVVTVTKGLARLRPGQVVPVVMARTDSNENHRLFAASIGVAIPADKNQYGYLSEIHQLYGVTDDQAGDMAEDLAASMLATTLGLDYDRGATWDEREKEWKISGKIYKTANVTQSAVGQAGVWTTVIGAAVLIP